MKDYINNVVDRLIREKEEKNVSPAGVTFTELMSEVKDDVLDIMRSLHTEHIYKGNKSLNDVIFTRWSDK